MSDKQERAVQARHLIEDGLFAERFAALEAEYIDRWKDAQTVQEREELHAKVRVMADIKLDLISVITSGDIEAANQKR